MKKKSAILKNSISGLVSQVTTILFAFLTRSLFIKYIGVELLGINSTFASVLGTLALAELGFQSAITYSLYRPLHDQDYETTNDIMNIFKMVYRCIGCIFILASFVVLPFLKYIVSDVQLTERIYLCFLLQAATSACTYFLAYKRALLYADQKDYLSKLVDLATNIVFNILQCICLSVWKNYEIYLIIKIVQTVLSNTIIHLYCLRSYPYLHRKALNKERFRTIWFDVKNVFASRIASFVYSSTDNLVISTFASTISVGFLVNYTTITKSLRTLCTSCLQPMLPVIGNHLVDVKSTDKRQELFNLYTHVRYLIAVFVIVPTIVLIDDFVTLWIGNSMLMERSIVILLAAEFYIDIVHTATLDYVYGAGLFREERNIEIIGALVNITTSVVLVQFIGIAGVLIGTVISQLLFWIGRSWVAYFQCLGQTKTAYWRYWIRNLIYAIVFVAGCYACAVIYQFVSIDSLLWRIAVGGAICEAFLMVYIVFIYWRLPEQRQLINAIRNIFNRK